MRASRIATLTLLLLLCTNATRAQFTLENSNLLYNSFRMPQASYYNPALFPRDNSFYLTFPAVNLLFNSPLAISDMMRYDPEQQITILDANSILNTLSENNDIRLGVGVDVLGMGVKINSTFFHLSMRARFEGNIGIPYSIINFLTQGNVDENDNGIADQTIVDGDLFNAQLYSELGIGIGHTFESIHLTLAGRFKMLHGFANVTTNNTRIALSTDPDLDQLTATVYYNLQASSIFDLSNADSSIALPSHSIDEWKAWIPENTGTAFDLGFNWSNEKLSISGSILDISSGIRWTQNTIQIKPKYGESSFSFSGLELSEMLDSGQLNTEDLSNLYQDRLDSILVLDTTFGDNGYATAIPTRINLGISYTLLKSIRAGVTFHGQFDKGFVGEKAMTPLEHFNYAKQYFRWNTTISLGFSFFDWMEIIASSAFVYDNNKLSFFNPGAGVILEPFKFFHIYVVADYVSSIYLVDAKNFNVNVGANILFGDGGKRKRARREAQRALLKETELSLPEEGEQPNEEQPTYEQPTNEQPTSAPAESAQPNDSQSSNTQSGAPQPNDNKPNNNQPTDEQPLPKNNE